MAEIEDKITVLTAPEITCSGCATSITNALKRLEGIRGVSVDITTKKVTVEHTEEVERSEMEAALDRAGFSTV